MPVNVAMHNPRASVVGTETDGDVVSSRGANANNIALDGVDKVIAVAASATDDTESVTVQVDRVLESGFSLCKMLGGRQDCSQGYRRNRQA